MEPQLAMHGGFGLAPSLYQGQCLYLSKLRMLALQCCPSAFGVDAVFWEDWGDLKNLGQTGRKHGILSDYASSGGLL